MNNKNKQIEDYLLKQNVCDYFDLIEEYSLNTCVANFDSSIFNSKQKKLTLNLRKNSLLNSWYPVFYIPFKYKGKKILIII